MSRCLHNDFPKSNMSRIVIQSIAMGRSNHIRCFGCHHFDKASTYTCRLHIQSHLAATCTQPKSRFEKDSLASLQRNKQHCRLSRNISQPRSLFQYRRRQAGIQEMETIKERQDREKCASRKAPTVSGSSFSDDGAGDQRVQLKNADKKPGIYENCERSDGG